MYNFSHYCKPTSVAVSQDTKTFYVADGYCNSRVIKYSITVTSDGKHAVNKITEWGKTAGVMSIKKVIESNLILHEEL